MKLCYIFTSAGLKSDSVQKKVIAQINALNLSGVKCRGAFFTLDVAVETRFNDDITLIPYKVSNRKYLNSIRQKKLLLEKVSEFIERTIAKDEYIYFRYPGASYELYKLAQKNKGRIISEHQSKEIDEIKSASNEHPLGLSPSKLISYFLYQFWPVYNERMWGGSYSKCLMAKTAVTNEIAEYHKKHCKNVWVIPNGIETINYPVRQVPAYKGTIKILFLKGTASLAPWNGLDRLINSIDAYQSGNVKIELVICGNIIEGEVPPKPYIIQKGYLNADELNDLFSTVHIGFSTLCLFRKNLCEAAVLKAREYFARGLPFVYAYTDPDIKEEDSINDCVLRVPNDDSIINFNEVIIFAQRIIANPHHPEEMRKFAEGKLDWKVKMKQLKTHLLAK